MSKLKDTPEPDARTLAEISALADGTLDPRRAQSVRALIEQSPELTRRYEREHDAVAALRALRSDRAPARLRMGIARQSQPAPRARVGLRYGGALAAGVAAVVAALILLLPGGTPGAPSVSQAAALALRGSAMAAPIPEPNYPATRLGQEVQDLYFPNWSDRFGWHAVGRRVDHLGGRLAVTVYYQRGARQIAYTILAAPVLRWPGTSAHRVQGIDIQSFTVGGRLVVTWRRAGHTCVLSGSGVRPAELWKLAAWKAVG